MRPKPNEPSRGLSFVGHLFCKGPERLHNRPKVTQWAGQAGQEAGEGIVLPEPISQQLQPEGGGPCSGRLRAQRCNIPVLIERKQLTTTLAMGVGGLEKGGDRVTRGWEVVVRGGALPLNGPFPTLGRRCSGGKSPCHPLVPSSLLDLCLPRTFLAPNPLPQLHRPE